MSLWHTVMRTWNRFTIFKENFIDFKMEDIICNANVYSAFLEGKATRREVMAILKRMISDPNLILMLNLAAYAMSDSQIDDMRT